MSNEILGKCAICKKEVTRHDISHKEEGQEHPKVLYYNKWPRGGFCCVEHPGVLESYIEALHMEDPQEKLERMVSK